ncbi:MAG TPA: hypothetical protein VHC91_12230 [Trinickia sp.]|uniref:hypothetical protein n=1 Tax=Trinickia sp. TaxID=2571163 RepID=UPI002BA16890|nr:hypothetical protein [Trinickia sp.]HVW51144.1 hypothetical protein [Trinickia sp.]
MSFDLPNLDVMQAQKVLDQLVRQIPGYAPGWTDHNPSDPGITLLQMLVWIAEGTAYTANAVPLETYRNMARWVAGLSNALALPSESHYATDFPYAKYADTDSQDPPYETLKASLAQMEMGARVGYSGLQDAVVTYRRAPYLAITPGDIKQLASQLSAFLDARAKRGVTPLHVARLCSRQRGDVTDLFLVNDAPCIYSSPKSEGDGTYSIALTSLTDDAQAAAETALVDCVRQYLAARTLLGGAITVTNAHLLYVDVQCEVLCFARERADEVAAAVLTALEQALQPVRNDGGRDWVYGSPVDETTLIPIIAAVPGVDRVESIELIHPQIALLRRPDLAKAAGLETPPLRPDSMGMMQTGLPRLYAASVTALEAGND